MERGNLPRSSARPVVDPLPTWRRGGITDDWGNLGGHWRVLFVRQERTVKYGAPDGPPASPLSLGRTRATAQLYLATGDFFMNESPRVNALMVSKGTGDQ